MAREQVIVLGGGLSGLAAAELLSKKHSVTVLEAAPFLGGLAANFRHKGKEIPLFYHHIIKSNTTTLDYLRRFGKVRSLEWQRIKLAIGVKGKVSIVNTPLGLLRFGYLTLAEKIRFGLFGLYTLMLMNPDRIEEGYDAESWLHRYAGKAVTRKIFHQLYSRNKFGIPLKRISARQFAHRLHEKEIQDDFTFPKGGYQPMIDGLAAAIKKRGGRVKKNAGITKIDLKRKEVVCDGKRMPYDTLLTTIPFDVFLKLTTGLPKELKERLARITYCPAVGLCFATKGFLQERLYWINLFDERVHIIMQHSVLSDSYGEKIHWCLRYGGSEADLKLSDDQIRKEYLKTIKRYYPDAQINWTKVVRTRYGEPIYDIDYHSYMPDYRSGVPGLYFAGIQLTYPRIRNMNAALDSGIIAARTILEDGRKNGNTRG